MVQASESGDAPEALDKHAEVERLSRELADTKKRFSSIARKKQLEYSKKVCSVVIQLWSTDIETPDLFIGAELSHLPHVHLHLMYKPDLRSLSRRLLDEKSTPSAVHQAARTWNCSKGFLDKHATPVIARMQNHWLLHIKG